MEQSKTPYNVHISRFTCSLKEGATCHFLPHEKNGYVPHVLKHRVLLAYSVILILLKALLVLGYAALPVASVYSSAVTGDNIIRLTNLARGQIGLPSLVPNDRLAIAAAEKAADMLEHQYFAHTSPEGLTPWDWIKRAGYRYRYAGENLAVHYFSAEGVHEGWMASPTHHENIVDERYVDIGVGIAQGTYDDYDTIFVVQMFGRPKGYEATLVTTEPTVVQEEPTTVAVISEEPMAQVVDPPQDVETVEVGVIEDVEPGTEGAEVVAGETTAEVLNDGVDIVPEEELLFPEPLPVETQESRLVVDDASLKILPKDGGYAIDVRIENADSAEVYLGPQISTLEMNEAGEFTGFVEGDETFTDGVRYVHIGASDGDGNRVVKTVAAVAPSGTTQDLFISGGRPGGTAKFLGVFEVHDLEDGVKRFYLFTIVFLVAALALKVAVKFHIQRHSIIMHTLLVIGLATILMFA